MEWVFSLSFKQPTILIEVCFLNFFSLVSSLTFESWTIWVNNRTIKPKDQTNTYFLCKTNASRLILYGVLVKDASSHSKPLRARFNYNLLSIDRSSNFPFIDPHRSTFLKEFWIKKSNTISKASFRVTLTRIWIRYAVFARNQLLKSLFVMSKLSQLRIMSLIVF
jgi:hypothetical protein